LGIKVKLMITSQATNFKNRSLTSLAYGGSSFEKTLKQTAFDIRWMIRTAVEISAVWIPVDFGGLRHLFLFTRTSRKGI
jgi:hypothetical protein